jgi:hypothetical protein
MDVGMVQQVVGWIEQQFGGQQQISKDELVSKAQGSNLPQEAKDSMQQLPQGSYTKDDLIGKVKDMMMQKVGSGMGGGMGGMMGGMGQGGGGVQGGGFGAG